MRERQHRRELEEKTKEKHTLQYDRFIDPSNVKHGILVKAGDDYIPVEIKPQKKQTTGWEGYTV